MTLKNFYPEREEKCVGIDGEQDEEDIEQDGKNGEDVEQYGKDGEDGDADR